MITKINFPKRAVPFEQIPVKSWFSWCSIFDKENHLFFKLSDTSVFDPKLGQVKPDCLFGTVNVYIPREVEINVLR